MLITKDRSIEKKVRHACVDLEVSLVHWATLPEAGRMQPDAPPDLVLCACSTFAPLREWLPRACVLLYTEPADSEQAIEAIKQGALDCLVTPIEAKVLAQHIAEALRVSRDIHVPAAAAEMARAVMACTEAGTEKRKSGGQSGSGHTHGYGVFP